MEALIGALDRVYGFDPLTPARGPNQPLMLVGAPGAGKTVTIAKLAARVMVGATLDELRRAGARRIERDDDARVRGGRVHAEDPDAEETRLARPRAGARRSRSAGRSPAGRCGRAP